MQVSSVSWRPSKGFITWLESAPSVPETAVCKAGKQEHGQIVDRHLQGTRIPPAVCRLVQSTSEQHCTEFIDNFGDRSHPFRRPRRFAWCIMQIHSPEESDISWLNHCQPTNTRATWLIVGCKNRKHRTHLLGEPRFVRKITRQLGRTTAEKHQRCSTESKFHVSISVLQLWPIRRPARMLQRRACV